MWEFFLIFFFVSIFISTLGDPQILIHQPKRLCNFCINCIFHYLEPNIHKIIDISIPNIEKMVTVKRNYWGPEVHPRAAACNARLWLAESDDVTPRGVTWLAVRPREHFSLHCLSQNRVAINIMTMYVQRQFTLARLGCNFDTLLMGLVLGSWQKIMFNGPALSGRHVKCQFLLFYF
jgi:hypothetical protein